GDLSAEVTWASSLDGPLGEGSRLDVTRLRAGTHTITASVVDRGGRTASAVLTVVVDAPPVVRITGPADGFDSMPGAVLPFTAMANDAEDGDLGTAIRWTSSLDGPLGGGSMLNVDGLRSGTHVISAQVTDGGGKSAAAAITVIVNAAPRLSIVTPTSGLTVGPADAVSLVAIATDVEDGDLGGGIAWTSDLDGALGTGATLVRSLRSGTHTITATVTDAGGKTARAAIMLVVNAAPTVRITGPADGALFAPTDTITLTGTAEDAEDGDLG